MLNKNTALWIQNTNLLIWKQILPPFSSLHPCKAALPSPFAFCTCSATALLSLSLGSSSCPELLESVLPQALLHLSRPQTSTKQSWHHKGLSLENSERGTGASHAGKDWHSDEKPTSPCFSCNVSTRSGHWAFRKEQQLIWNEAESSEAALCMQIIK